MSDEKNKTGSNDTPESISDGLDDPFFDNDQSMAELGGKGAGGGNDEGVDVEDAEELERIMKPARGRARHPILAGLVTAASLVLLFMMRSEIMFFFQGSDPRDLGKVDEALAAGKMEANTYVRLRGVPDINSWATVSRRGCSVTPKSAPKSYYSFYILRKTDDSVVVRRSLDWKQRIERQKRKVIELDVTGRLIPFRDKKEYFLKYRGFLKALSKRNPNLRRRHEIAPKELRRNLGRRRPRLIDHKGRKVRIEPQDEIALYVVFPRDLEISVNRAHKVTADKVTFKGGRGAAACRPTGRQRGGDVVLVRDRDVFDFGGIQPKTTVAALDASTPPGRAAGGKDKAGGPQKLDRIIRVPANTRVFDSETGDPVAFEKRRLVVARGGACKQKGQIRTLNLEAQPFVSRRNVELYVARFGKPYTVVEESKFAVDFIVRASVAEAQEMIKRQRRGDPYTISLRTEWYLCRWNELRMQEDTLIISPARPVHPRQYVVAHRPAQKDTETGQAGRGEGRDGVVSAGRGQSKSKSKSARNDKSRREAATPTKSGARKNGVASAPNDSNKPNENKTKLQKVRARLARLQKKSLPHTVSITFGRIQKARFNTARSLDEKAWILLEGVEPMDFWYYPAIAVLLLGFVVFNLLAIKNYFKHVRKSRPDPAA